MMYAIPAKIAQFPPRLDDLDSAIMPPFRFICKKLSEFKSNNVKSQLFDPELIDHQSLKKQRGWTLIGFENPKKAVTDKYTIRAKRSQIITACLKFIIH